MTHLLAQLETAFRQTVAHNRSSVQTPGFTVHLADSDAYFLNVAVPLGNPPDWGTSEWDTAIPEMTAAFLRGGRRPRLELFDELHPTLAAALERQGFRLEMRAPVMALTPEALAAPPLTPAETYVRLSAHAPGRSEAFARRQAVAFGGSEADDPVFLPGLRAGLADGSILAAGLERDGRFVSGATLMLGDPEAPSGVAELAGVWTAPTEQRRGLAFAVCQRLLAEYFAQHSGAGPALAWLSAAEGAMRLYQTLGFQRVGTQLNYGLPE